MERQQGIAVSDADQHGKDSIHRRTGITVYPIDFKLNAVSMVIHKGLSQKATCAHLNLPTNSLLTQWLSQYRQYSIDGLKAKPKGRQPVKKTKQAKAPKKADHLKAKEELMEELLYLHAEMAVLKNPMP